MTTMEMITRYLARSMWWIMPIFVGLTLGVIADVKKARNSR